MINFLLPKIEAVRSTMIKRIVEFLFDLDHDHTYTVVVKAAKRSRSLEQNSLYWVWIAEISRETGNSAATLHDHFRSEYLPKVEIIVKLGDKAHKRERLMSTTELSVEDFTNYLTQIQAAMGEMGIVLSNEVT